MCMTDSIIACDHWRQRRSGQAESKCDIPKHVATSFNERLCNTGRCSIVL